MCKRTLIPIFVVVAGIAVSGPLSVMYAQTASSRNAAKPWSPPRTANGQPDLQGAWDFKTITPLERPAALGERAFFTDEEAVEFERARNLAENRDLIDDKKGGALYPPGGVVPYNEFWYDRGSQVSETKRTSLIIDPKDGRLPPLTPDGERRAREREQGRLANQTTPKADSYRDRSFQERCLVGFNAGPPMVSDAYNNNVQIVQSAGYVAIMTEMVHDVRIVPLDGRPRTGLRYAMGESRGHFDGNTLVVETANFSRGTSLRGSTSTMHLVERFTLTDAKTLLYEFTVTDPSTWTAPWTAQTLMSRLSGDLYEYACHEGNHSLGNVLAGARAQEKNEAAAGPSNK